MDEVQVSAGPLEYQDTGGDGPVLLFLHGLMMDGAVFDGVVGQLRDTYRCVVPTLPLGAHRKPMRPDADLTLSGYGRMVAELMDALDLRDVTLVQNDHAAAHSVAVEHADRVARLVLASCEAFDNYPPGLPGKNIRVMSHVPGGLTTAMQLMRVRPLRRLPIGLGWLTKRPIPHEITDRWFRPIQTDRRIRRDLHRYVKTARPRVMVELTQRLASFDRPTLVIWAKEDRIMPPEHGRRLAELLPDARLVEVADSYTLIPWDQPDAFAAALREFVPVDAPAGASTGSGQ